MLQEHLEEVEERIAAACRRAGRDVFCPGRGGRGRCPV